MSNVEVDICICIVDFLVTHATSPQHMDCICNIVVIVERCDIGDIIDSVGSGGGIGSGSSGSDACASVGSRAFFFCWYAGMSNNYETYRI